MAGYTLRERRWACARPRKLVLIMSVYCIRNGERERRWGGENPTLYYKERQERKGERCECYAETGREHEVLPER